MQVLLSASLLGAGMLSVSLLDAGIARKRGSVCGV